MIKQFKPIYFIITLCMMVVSFHSKAQVTQAPSADQGNQITFIENDWSGALKQAAKQKKYIFVDAYASWCGPCKMLKLTTFKNNKAAKFYNQNFVNVALDMEKGIGPKLAAAWGMTAYPTLIIFDPAGKPVLVTVGFLKADDLIAFGQQALDKKAND